VKHSWRDALSMSGWWRLRPVDATWLSALRAMIGSILPVVVVVLAGHIELVPAAAFGGLTAIYARFEPYPVRGRILAVLGMGITAAVGVGSLTVALHASAMVAVLAVAMVAALSRMGTDVIAAGAPGVLVFVFATATTAALPTTWAGLGAQMAAAAGGAATGWLVAMAPGLVDPLGPVRLAVARALDAVALRDRAQTDRHAAAAAIEAAWRALSTAPYGGRHGAIAARLEAELARAETVLHGGAVAEPRMRARARVLRRPVLVSSREEREEIAGRRAVSRWQPGWRPRWGAALRAALRPGSPEIGRALRVLVGAFVAGLLGHGLHLGHPYWATVAAAAVLQSTNLRHTLHRAVQRGLGTVAGAVLAWGLLELHLPQAWVVAGIAVALFGGELMIMRNYALAMLFVTPLTLLLTSLAGSPDDTVLISDRVVNTALGATLGVLAACLVPGHWALTRLRAAVWRVQRACDLLAADPADLRAARAEAIAAVVALRQAWDVVGGEPVDADAGGIAYAELVLGLEQRSYRLIAESTDRLTRALRGGQSTPRPGFDAASPASRARTSRSS
jgi:hypothetical protein